MIKRIQNSHYTEYDRYPEVFEKISALSSNDFQDKVKILSYGCSNGAVSYTIANKYLQNSKIIGVDISEEKLNEARQENLFEDKIEYLYSNIENLEKHSPYDIVFAMSVFCRWPDTETMDDISEYFPFSLFEQQLCLIDNYIKVGGYFVIYNANYSLYDTVLKSKYDALVFNEIPSSGFVHRFDKAGKKISGQFQDCIFKKIK